MNRQVMRWVAGANLLAGCLLLAGCGTFGARKTAEADTKLPDVDTSVVAVEPVEITQPAAVWPKALPSVASTTPYSVQKGDTLSGIAYKYGLRWQDIVAVNPGIAPNSLRIGQIVHLPGQVDVARPRPVPGVTPRVAPPKTAAPVAAGTTVSYKVVAGDSLSVIAQRHGSSVAAIREANSLKSDRIQVGQTLKIPNAKKSVAAASPTAKPTATAPKTEPPKTAAVKPAAPPTAKPAAPVVESAPVAAPPAMQPPPAETTPAPAPAPAAAEVNAQTYTVKEGEDLYAVAIRWGVSPSDLKSLNNLTSTELKAGTVLKIPSVQ